MDYRVSSRLSRVTQLRPCVKNRGGKQGVRGEDSGRERRQREGEKRVLCSNFP